MPDFNAMSLAPGFRNIMSGGSGGGGGSGMIAGDGSGVRAYDPRYGGIPTVPNPTSTATSAITGNLNNASNIYNLATGAGSAAGAGVIEALNKEIPGISGTIGTATGNINQLLSGQVPSDVVAMLAQHAAEVGAGSGMGPMSPSTTAGYLRALGLTSLDMQKQGQSELDALMGSVPRAPAFDPSSMFVTPGQQQEWSYLGNELAAAPVPSAAAAANVAALREGVGAGTPSPVGGFNLPIRGGPAFTEAPMSSGVYGPDVTVGSTGTGYDYSGPSPSDYSAWQRYAASLPGSAGASTAYGPLPGMTAEDFYNLGLTPAEEAAPEYANEEDYYGAY